MLPDVRASCEQVRSESLQRYLASPVLFDSLGCQNRVLSTCALPEACILVQWETQQFKLLYLGTPTLYACPVSVGSDALLT